MGGARGRTRSARLAALSAGVALIVGLAGIGAGASSVPSPHLHAVHVSAKRVPPGGTFTITAVARHRVVEDYAVTFVFDLDQVDLVDEQCTDVSGPQNADTPSCEYDNVPLVATTTFGVFRVASGVSGTLAVKVCANVLQSGAHADCRVKKVRVR